MHSLLALRKMTRLVGRCHVGSQGRMPGRGHRLVLRKELISMSGLFGSRVLEASLGMASVYLLLAMFCSTVNEWIASLFAVRSCMLEKGLARLLGEAAEQFYEHPLIQALIHDGAHPDHIAAGTFAKTVMDLATPAQPGSIGYEDLERGIANDLPPGRLRTSLLAIIQGTDKRVDAAQRAIEKWFDDAMDGVSRRYKRRAQLSTTLLAGAITLGANADSVRLARTLLSGQEAAVALGWNGTVASWASVWPQSIVGWMLTAAAVSLGAPFWFDVVRNLAAATRPRMSGRADMQDVSSRGN